LPVIDAPVDLGSFLARGSSGEALHLLFAERGGESMSMLPSELTSKTVVAFIGSEGGWAEEELELARKQRWKIVTLGGRILRAETAAISVAVLIQHLYGDLR
jgi:16S rRNA (uracil1498-N3)-methyltransferase